MRGGACFHALQKGSVSVGPLGGRHLEGMDSPGRPWAPPAPLGNLISASGLARCIQRLPQESALLGGELRRSGLQQAAHALGLEAGRLASSGPPNGVGRGPSAPRFFLGKPWSCPAPTPLLYIAGVEAGRGPYPSGWVEGGDWSCWPPGGDV